MQNSNNNNFPSRIVIKTSTLDLLKTLNEKDCNEKDCNEKDCNEIINDISESEHPRNLIERQMYKDSILLQWKNEEQIKETQMHIDAVIIRLEELNKKKEKLESEYPDIKDNEDFQNDWKRIAESIKTIKCANYERMEEQLDILSSIISENPLEIAKKAKIYKMNTISSKIQKIVNDKLLQCKLNMNAEFRNNPDFKKYSDEEIEKLYLECLIPIIKTDHKDIVKELKQIEESIHNLIKKNEDLANKVEKNEIIIPKNENILHNFLLKF